MKTLNLLLCMSFFLSLTSFGQAYEKLKEDQVNQEKIGIAKKFATDYMSAQKNGTYYQFKDEAIDVVKNALTESNQKAGYTQLRDQYGDFKSLSYAETWIQKGNPAYQIIRFKADFDKRDQPLEIRVILDPSDKIAGLWIKPWSDSLM